MKVPLLDGGSQADDPHQQQGGVFTVLSCHLNTTQRRIFNQDQLLKRASTSFRSLIDGSFAHACLHPLPYILPPSSVGMKMYSFPLVPVNLLYFPPAGLTGINVV